MASFSTIPGELVSEILFQLPQTDLCSISRVNKYFNVLAEPALYHSITWEGPSREPPIVPLLCTLFTRPDLCAYVKHIRFRNNFYSLRRLPGSSNKDHSRVSLTNNQLRQCDKFVNESSIPLKSAWMDWIKFGSVDCLLSLLIWQLPNLKTLHVHRTTWNGYDFLKTVFCYALCTEIPWHGLTRFPHLEQVEILPGMRYTESRWREGKPSNREAFPFSFFYLPSIRTLVCSSEDVNEAWKGSNEPIPIWLYPLKISETLTSLDIRDVFRDTHLGFTIAKIPTLRKLRLTFNVYIYTSVFNCSEFELALTEGAGKLEELCLVLDNTANRRVDDESGRLLVNKTLSFRSFEKLRTLEIPPMLLLGQRLPRTFQGSGPLNVLLENVLPRNLKHLTLTSTYPLADPGEPIYDEPTVRGAFENWWHNWKASTPKLEDLTLSRLSFEEFESFDPEWREVSQLVKLGRSSGVGVVVRKRPETVDEMALRWARSTLDDD